MTELSKLSEQYHVHIPTCTWYRDLRGSHGDKMKSDFSIKCDCWYHKDSSLEQL